MKKEKLEVTRLENRVKKLEITHEVEKRNLKIKIKNKCKDKYNIRVDELQKNFKLELKLIID